MLKKVSPKNYNGNISFDIGDELATIHTSHFSGYIVTAKHINCCGKSANVHLFASLRNIQEAKPLATVKVYLSSILSDIEDYQCVRFFLSQEILTNSSYRIIENFDHVILA